MAERNKKMAAALAAVNAYLQQEEALVSEQMAASSVEQARPTEPNCWGMSGRVEMMTMRRLIQMRAFGRIS
jgi:hypothetical protein